MLNEEIEVSILSIPASMAFILDIEPELLAKAKNKVAGIEENNIDEKEIEKMSNELEVLCKENGLPDLSKNIEMLLTYILFPNIALSFFKELDI